MKRFCDNCNGTDNRHRRNLLDRISAISFAVGETTLYLDGHPNHRMALAYYTKMKNELDALTGEYEMKYGPLSGLGIGGSEQQGWQWVKQPWPWELNYPEGGDHPELNEPPVKLDTRGEEE